MKLIDCRICDGSFLSSREHCPYCSARRVFVASGRVLLPAAPYYYDEHLSTRITHRSPDLVTEIVRAFRSDIAYAATRESHQILPE